MNAELRSRLRAAHTRLVAALLSELGPQGYWVGELSSSALSTATAVIALAAMGEERDAVTIHAGLRWLAHNVNSDGGWGDTVRSKSNLSTTALAWAAFGITDSDAEFRDSVRNAVAHISFVIHAADSQASRTESSRLPDCIEIEPLISAIEARYGDDRTFSVPIIMTLALSGRLGERGWQRVRPLPFELAALPRGLFGALRLPVVSYALPALIAIGQVIHQRAKRVHPLRTLAARRTLDVLTTLQPENGGFLEAIPLTSFVTMSLAGMRRQDHVVARRGADFLRQSVRPDGSWPIDTNLCTWVTTLAIKALQTAPGALNLDQRTALREWLLNQQHRIVHPYTGAAPGGWAWSHLPGGVPDADDTAGALLALHLLNGPNTPVDSRTLDAAIAGVRWLLALQNRDGGIPTFCRGWGNLPFDRSTPELTAHALRAWAAWRPLLPDREASRIHSATTRALKYLRSSQRADGAWIPLWFGNENAQADENPVYGTAQVVSAIETFKHDPIVNRSYERAFSFLAHSQNADGGWGGANGAPSTIEETSVALEAMSGPTMSSTIERGAQWLLNRLDEHTVAPAPIGLYFARLWYFERLYPLIFGVGALGKLLSHQR